MVAFLNFLLLAYLRVSVDALRNVAITSKNIAIATNSNQGLISRILPGGSPVSTSLPPQVDSFDDLSIDKQNENLVFALSTTSNSVSSFSIGEDGTLTFVSTTPATSSTPTSPFAGISALGGVLIVSGGTRGLSVFTYDGQTGSINETPVVLAQAALSNVVGHPDVVLITPQLAALQTDLSSGFGNVIANIGADSVTLARTFTHDAGSGFNFFSNSIRPASFAFVGDVLSDKYLVTAAGTMTVVDATVDGATPTQVQGAPSGFEAVTVSVSPDNSVVYFGGLVNGESLILKYDAADPLNLVFERSFTFGGRITSLAVGIDIVAIGTENGSELGYLEPQSGNSATSNAEIARLGALLLVSLLAMLI